MDPDRSDLRCLVRALDRSRPETFISDVADVLDLDGFLRFAALRAVGGPRGWVQLQEMVAQQCLSVRASIDRSVSFHPLWYGQCLSFRGRPRAVRGCTGQGQDAEGLARALATRRAAVQIKRISIVALFARIKEAIAAFGIDAEDGDRRLSAVGPTGRRIP